jgi:hypothetical protein
LLKHVSELMRDCYHVETLKGGGTPGKQSACWPVRREPEKKAKGNTGHTDP